MRLEFIISWIRYLHDHVMAYAGEDDGRSEAVRIK